jgi:hypothetical protein
MTRKQISAAKWKRIVGLRIRALKLLARKRHARNCPHIARALAVCGSKKWSSARLGDLVELTDEERERWKLWPIRPCDVPWWKIQQRRKERNRAANRERMRKRREAMEMAKDLDERQESIWAAAPPGGWVSIRELVTRLRSGRAWAALNDNSLRRVVRRTVDRMAAKGLLETRFKTGTNGPEMLLFRPERHPDTRTVTAWRESYARKAREMRTTRVSQGMPSSSENVCDDNSYSIDAHRCADGSLH